MSRAALAASLGLLLAIPTWAHAATSPMPGSTDSRIRTVVYDPDQVVRLNGFFGFQMMIEFGADEKIENVSVGDGLAWQITPNRKANLLFLKPVERAAPTNMTVVTDRRRYTFELTARNAGGPRTAEMAYVVRFVYRKDPSLTDVELARPAPERLNTAYTYKGSRTSLPSVVFDDGHFTYFQWPQAAATPALFMLNRDGSESMVNFTVRDGYVVVEQVAPRFQLRNGREITTIVNNGWRDPVPAATAPRPADRKTQKAAARAARGK